MMTDQPPPEPSGGQEPPAGGYEPAPSAPGAAYPPPGGFLPASSAARGLRAVAARTGDPRVADGVLHSPGHAKRQTLADKMLTTVVLPI